jgi:hypothetical protein
MYKFVIRDTAMLTEDFFAQTNDRGIWNLRIELAR